MRIIIAGGSGLIGRALANLLNANGDEVIILSRRPDAVKGLPANVKAILWDARTLVNWGTQVDHSDAIINLTGENLSGEGFFPSRWNKARKIRLVQSRVDSGKVLTKAIEFAKTKPSVFIQACGVGFYGTQQEKILTEDDKAGNDFSAKLCIEWEASSLPVEMMGVRRVVVRNGVVLSTKRGALPLLLLPYKLWVGGPLGDGKQVYSWIHIEDEANALFFLLRNEKAIGTFNLTSPNPVTDNEFGRAIGKVMKRPHYLTIPGFAMKLAFGEVAEMVLRGQRVIPQNLLRLGYVFKFPRIEDALQDLLKAK